MPRIERTSDIIEQHSERATFSLFGGVGFGLLAFLLLRYSGDGMFVPLGYIFAAGAVACFLWGGYTILGVRRVAAHAITCPFCTETVELAAKPTDTDVPCSACNRMIPVQSGVVLSVNQVRCGYCNGLNYYSEKTEVLLCESCNHEVPIARADGQLSTKRIAKGYAVVEDDALYELVLTGGKENEELISCLQHMLALNRNQVKEIVESPPVTLLQGITRMKAEMLKAQIESHHGEAEMKVLADAGVA